ncbi:MAG: dTMP kinase [Desulfobulbaceae bacterium]|nr:dTMP kinase [Desulfobulbaceae bacterium]
MKDRRGHLIVFEGIDGTGKSTQISELAKYLTGQGYEVVTTREPTDGPYGQKIRQLYTDRTLCDAKEELDLFINDRRQHVNEVIAPALRKGKIVLSDRYYFSTAAYQGANGCDPDEIFKANSFAPQPDLMLLLTMDVEQSVYRIKKLRGDEPDHFEGVEYLRKVSVLFDSFTHPFIKRIAAASVPDKVSSAIIREVELLLRGTE